MLQVGWWYGSVPDFLDEAYPWAGEAMDGLEFPNGLAASRGDLIGEGHPSS
jgi:hypothetical protein